MQNKQCLLKIFLINLLPSVQIQKTPPQAQHALLCNEKAVLSQTIGKVFPKQGFGDKQFRTLRGEGDLSSGNKSTHPRQSRCSLVLKQLSEANGGICYWGQGGKCVGGGGIYGEETISDSVPRRPEMPSRGTVCCMRARCLSPGLCSVG